MLSLLWAWDQSLVRELRSHKPRGTARKKKKKTPPKKNGDKTNEIMKPKCHRTSVIIIIVITKIQLLLKLI